jgi:hypothetical protein
MYYSASNNAFYPAELKSSYKLAGTWPSDAVEVSKSEWETYGRSAPPEGMQRGADESGRPAWVAIPAAAIDKLAAQRRAEMDTARDQAFAAGLPYDIAGEPDVVQTRPQDQINLLGLSSKAQRLLAAGDTETLIPFRGLSNVNHGLTAQQMDDLTMAALAHIESIYQRSWDRKDAIDAALAAEDREGIEAVVW